MALAKKDRDLLDALKMWTHDRFLIGVESYRLTQLLAQARADASSSSIDSINVGLTDNYMSSVNRSGSGSFSVETGDTFVDVAVNNITCNNKNNNSNNSNNNISSSSSSSSSSIINSSSSVSADKTDVINPLNETGEQGKTEQLPVRRTSR